VIISRAPFRISLGGGGTDLPSYYEKYEGFLIAGAINKHIYVGANKQFYDNYSLKYSKIEIKNNIKDIDHKLIRESLKMLDIKPGIEITSLSDIPSKTGLGSSGAFLVALLNTLYHYRGTDADRRTVAENACRIELKILKEHEGKQDKYVSAFGGVKAYKFEKNGTVKVIRLVNEDIITTDLQKNLLLFFTGHRRSSLASDVLKDQDQRIKKEEQDMTEYINEIKEIGLASKEALEEENFEFFGSLMHRHWLIKKKYSKHTSNKEIDKLYDFALKRGAIGGKTIGAPGGGFMMFYHSEPEKDKWSFIKDMEEVGLKYTPFKFDNDGVKVISKEENNG